MPWSAWIHTGFHVSRATQDTTRSTLVFEYGAITLFGPTFQTVLISLSYPSLDQEELQFAFAFAPALQASS